MKIAIMQPYLFPYFGYFQLIAAVDFFGIGDDVQFIKAGWINRNRILANNTAQVFTFSVQKDSSKKTILERYYSDLFKKDSEKLLRILNIYYKKAPYFKIVLEVIENVLAYDDMNVSRFNENQLKLICNYLNINTSFLKADMWKINEDESYDTQERVIKKLRKLEHLNIDHFINSIGGVDLYKKDFFAEYGYKLNFIKSGEIYYKQFNSEFISNLSIIDVLMFNSIEEINHMLKNYQLV